MRVLARGKFRGSSGGGWPTMPKPIHMAPGTSGSDFVVPADWTPGTAATRCRSLPIVESTLQCGRPVPGLRQPGVRGDHVGGVVARVHVDETDEAADEQGPADEEDRGERDLDDYEDAAQAVALQEAELAHPLNAGITQGRHDVDARSLQGRCEPQQKSGRERQQQREQQHASVDGDLVHPWNVARADRGQGPLQHEGEANTQDAAADSQQHALRQELPGETPRTRTERGADGELALTPGPARQEKVGDVGSRR